MILNHVSVGVSNVTSAVVFYDSVLSALSIKRSHYIENVAAAYGENFEFWVGCPCENVASSGNGTHIAFNAPNQDAVDQFMLLHWSLVVRVQASQICVLNTVKLTMRRWSEMLMETNLKQSLCS
ncbi:lactoylglutathione lyase [Vibrio parahaemolyticus]|nr:lactoylglutathione lyase [Vibrio parahaemolyticus]